jgi:hypothetical protein
MEDAKHGDPMPPLIWWLIGAAVLSFIIMGGDVGLYQAVWWLGLLIIAVVIAVSTLWTRNSLGYDSKFYTLADLTTRLFWIAAALIFLFGVLVAGSAVLDPIFSAISGSDDHVEELPENWRR